MRVGFLTDAPRIAGSEIWLREMLPLLPPQRITPELFIRDHPRLEPLRRALEAKGIQVHYLKELHKKPSFDLWVLQLWSEPSYRLLFQLPPPRWVVCHDQLEYFYPLGLRTLYHLGYRMTKARWMSRAEGVLTVSTWGAQFLRRLGLEAEAVPNGVDPERYRPASPEERRALRERLGLKRFSVLVPGRFALEKNQILVAAIARRTPEFDYWLVGDQDSLIGHLLRRLQLPNLYLKGRREDLVELYQAFDAVLQPTLAENQSLVTLEAMSSGLPVVTTPIPAQAELIEHGKEGLLVPPQTQPMVEALRALAHNPTWARQLGQAARDRILREHTLATSALRLAEVLRCASTG
jgi:glycosyltransferase involved in cell wall biosynthesis